LAIQKTYTKRKTDTENKTAHDAILWLYKNICIKLYLQHKTVSQVMWN